MNLSKTAVTIFLMTILLTANSLAQQTDINGPVGSELFGTEVVVLPNGNIVVTDPRFDLSPTVIDVGAVYLYDGSTGAVISRLTGSTNFDVVGIGGITVLSNGNYVINSPLWDGTANSTGAVTLGNATMGVSGTVSVTNSLVGSSVNDRVGSSGVTALTNGNYVVSSSSWDNGSRQDVGAATLCNGTTPTVGPVSVANSLISSSENSTVSSGGVTALTNGNYLVISPNWDTATLVQDVGAVTFGNGTSGTVGEVLDSNSIVGSTTNDFVGTGGVIELANGNFIVSSTQWNDGGTQDVGAVTFGNGISGTFGTVSSANSLVGSTADDNVGNEIIALTNGNYVIASPDWDNGGTQDVGAVTFGNGTSGIFGTISAANSLIGSTQDDSVGNSALTALTNGNYVVGSSGWDNGGLQNVGAATFGDGANGTVGTISNANSVVGSMTSDGISSFGITALTNGNYIVRSPFWDTPTVINVGAVTFGNGTSGTLGAVSATNSLIGSTSSDNVGIRSVTVLSNGNYVVRSPEWDGTATNAGAATFGDGTNGTVGEISATNSLVGSATNDVVSLQGVTALTNGNYVVLSPVWNSTTANDAGAATFGDGTNGTVGEISATNSLIGTSTDDEISLAGVVALTNGNYVVISPGWDSSTQSGVGAATFGDGINGTVGEVTSTNSLIGSTTGDNIGNNGVFPFVDGKYAVFSSRYDGADTDVGAVSYLSGFTGNLAALGNSKLNSSDYKREITNPNNLAVSMNNSVIGTTPSGGNQFNIAYDPANDQLVVGRPTDNIVTLFSRLGITAAEVSISGRVQTSSGRGIPRAIVSITDSTGQIRTARTNGFGYFKFEDVEAGDIYILNARAKAYSFDTQILNVNDDIRKLTITAN